MSDYSLANLTRPAARPRRTGLVVTLTVVAVVVLAGIVGGLVLFLNSAGKMTVNGTVTIPAEAAGAVDGDSCSGHDAFTDVDKGTEVQITDAGSATVALTQLEAGRITGGGCTFAWTAAGVPTGKKFYGVQVGHRDPVKVPEVQLHQLVALALG